MAMIKAYCVCNPANIRHACKNTKGAVSVEQMVLIFVALTIGTVMFIFRATVVAFIQSATDRLGGSDFNL